MRRALNVGLIAALAAGVLGLPAASAAGGDQADSRAAAKQAPASPTGTWLHEKLGSASDQDWFRFTLAGSGRALITLGHLPADYALAVYRADGSRLASSDNSGRRFEQLYRALPAGDVFVRVTSSSGGVKPSVAYALKLRPLPRTMVIAEQRDVGDTAGYDIKGELLNNTADWRDVLRVHVVWVDNNGNAVGSQDEGVIPGPVGPHKRVQFSVEETQPPAGTAGYRLSVDSRLTNRRTPQGLVLTPGKRTESPTQRVYKGTIKNTSSQTIRGVYPTVIEYDSLGRAIAFGFDNTGTLAPGESKNYVAAINIQGLPKLNGYRSFYSVTKP